MSQSQTISAHRTLFESIEYHLRYTVATPRLETTKDDVLHALAYSLRERLIDGLLQTEERVRECGAKRMVYLSAEFLIGQSLRNNLFNLKLLKEAEEAVEALGFDLSEIVDSESDAPLGNGGLGRLAACFLESLATLGMPGYGYGINYQFGLFKQEIDNGHQKEEPDQWLYENSPWLIQRAGETCTVPLYGRVESGVDKGGRYNPMWIDWQVIIGVPHDVPVAGYGGETVNYLRLYSARASDEFDMEIFNAGDYVRAVDRKIAMETISKVLYPSDTSAAGQELRLIQEYFMVACALRDTVRRFCNDRPGIGMRNLHEYAAFQMNDTHPALVVAELMRLLVDEFALSWGDAWSVTHAACGYTNHTLMPEALEKWPVSLLERVLPRHLQIIYEINQRFLAEVQARFPAESDRIERMSLIGEGAGRREVRMANLAIVGSHSVNGVAALHTELVKTKLVPEFYEQWPERFNNKTNGVTHRRWLAVCNPDLRRLIDRTIGEGWITNYGAIRGLEAHAAEEGFQHEFLRIKQQNKERLARLICATERVMVDPNSLFDIQVKRMHEYKRQLLNAMHVMYSYLALVDEGCRPVVPRTYIFAGKAAPGYWMAKLIIKLINNIAEVVNNDSRTEGVMRVVFLRDYRVSLAERIIPAANLSEQISTAGMEASGTGNMKFAMNGALTIGTLDGANVEILQEVGADNIYIFGLTTEEIEAQRSTNDPRACYCSSAIVRKVIDALGGDRFCPNERGLFQPIISSLLEHGDRYFNLADLDSYIAAQRRVDCDFVHPCLWAQKAILNVARSGKFTSDRTIAEYAGEIWGIESAANYTR